MKFRRIVPALSLLSISSIVTPLCLTSCSQDTFYTFDLTDESNLPEVEGIATEGALDGPGATDAYLEVIKNDPKILMNDYIRGQYANVCSLFSGPDFKIKEFTISATTPKIGESIVHYPASVVAEPENPDLPYPTASFKVKYHLVVDKKSILSETKRSDTTFNIDFTAQYKDVLFTVYSQSNTEAARNDLQIEGLWHVGYLDPSDIGITSGRAAPYVFKFATDPWSVKVNYDYSYNSKVTDTVTGRTIVTNDSYSFASVLDTFTKLDSVLLTIRDAEAKLKSPETSADDYLDAVGQYCLISGVSFDYKTSAMAGVASTIVPYLGQPEASLTQLGDGSNDTIFKLTGFTTKAYSEELGTISSYVGENISGFLPMWRVSFGSLSIDYNDASGTPKTWTPTGLQSVSISISFGTLLVDAYNPGFWYTPISGGLYSKVNQLYDSWALVASTDGLQKTEYDSLFRLALRSDVTNPEFAIPDLNITITTSEGNVYDGVLQIGITPTFTLPVSNFVEGWIGANIPE